MPMDAEQNSALRFKGWNVFRSSSRDHMVPSVSGGRVLQRLRIQEAFPVSGVSSGVAVELDQRTEQAAVVSERRSRISGGEDVAQGITQYLAIAFRNSIVGGVGADFTEETVLVGTVPFTGYITELIARASGSDFGAFVVAIRSSSGQTMFKGLESNNNPLARTFLEPDFVPFGFNISGNDSYNIRDLRMPVFVGDVISMVVRMTNSALINSLNLNLILGVEAYVLGSESSRAAVSAFGVSASQMAKANRDAQASADRLAIEREKTARMKMELDARLKLADMAKTGAKVKQTLPPPPPPAPYADSPFTPQSGEGKTFVSSWMPNENSIGYLVPTPPRGGKVNTFGDEYSVFDITGKLIDRGKVELVRSQDQIPPSSRLSPNIRTTLSPDTRQSQADILATRRGESAFG